MLFMVFSEAHLMETGIGVDHAVADPRWPPTSPPGQPELNTVPDRIALYREFIAPRPYAQNDFAGVSRPKSAGDESFHTRTSRLSNNAHRQPDECRAAGLTLPDVDIGHTFSPAEQDQFIDLVHEENPSVFVLCLRYGFAQPSMLLRHVDDCFAAQPGGSRLCVIEKSNVVAWPKKAS